MDGGWQKAGEAPERHSLAEGGICVLGDELLLLGDSEGAEGLQEANEGLQVIGHALILGEETQGFRGEALQQRESSQRKGELRLEVLELPRKGSNLLRLLGDLG